MHVFILDLYDSTIDKTGDGGQPLITRLATVQLLRDREERQTAILNAVCQGEFTITS